MSGSVHTRSFSPDSMCARSADGGARNRNRRSQSRHLGCCCVLLAFFFPLVQLATSIARQVAAERLAELEASAGEEEQSGEAAGEEAAAVEEQPDDTREPIGDEEDEDEEPKKKSRKRLRKKEEDSDAEEHDADEDYSEERASKKKKAKKASSSKSKSASSSSAAAAAASSSSATAALLAFPVPKTPFQIFHSSERRTMKDEHPDATPSELSKLINDKWNALDDDAKAEFEQLARKQKTDHAADLARLKEEDPEAYSKHIKAVKKREEESLSGPGGKKKKRAEYDDDPADGHDPDNPPAELSYFDSIVHDLKSKKQTKSVLNDEEQKDMETAFMDKMMNAAKRDEEAAAAGKPAVHKLKMLPDVQAQLSKSVQTCARDSFAALRVCVRPSVRLLIDFSVHLSPPVVCVRSKVADRMLDSGLLRCLCAWIAPEADGSLPNVRLRTVVYQLLETLNVNETNLANSQGLGKRVMRLWKEPEETLPNKRILESLMEKWMRPMLGLSTDYRKSSEHEEERAQEIFRRKAIIDAQPKPLNYNPKRARIPEPARFDYAIRPQATEDHEAAEEEAREVAKKQPVESRKQMLTKKLDKMSRAGSNIAKPRFKVDITGRASNL